MIDRQSINVLIHPFLLDVYLHLNLVKGLLVVVLIEDNDMLFGQIVFNDDTIMFTLKNELQMFQWLFLLITKTKNSLV